MFIDRRRALRLHPRMSERHELRMDAVTRERLRQHTGRGAHAQPSVLRVDEMSIATCYTCTVLVATCLRRAARAGAVPPGPAWMISSCRCRDRKGKHRSRANVE